MKKNERAQKILEVLLSAKAAVPGETLSELFGVSRQIIVKDIATLRAEKYDIASTHFGYVYKASHLKSRDFKVKHTTEDTENELSIIVKHGAIVENVYVWHKVYGKISADLGIFSEEHIKNFMEGVRSGKSTELMNITGGYHYHNVRAESEEALDAIEEELKSAGYLVLEE